MCFAIAAHTLPELTTSTARYMPVSMRILLQTLYRTSVSHGCLQSGKTADQASGSAIHCCIYSPSASHSRVFDFNPA